MSLQITTSASAALCNPPSVWPELLHSGDPRPDPLCIPNLSAESLLSRAQDSSPYIIYVLETVSRQTLEYRAHPICVHFTWSHVPRCLVSKGQGLDSQVAYVVTCLPGQTLSLPESAQGWEVGVSRSRMHQEKRHYRKLSRCLDTRKLHSWDHAVLTRS